MIRVPIPARVGQKKEVTALCIEAHDLILAKCVAGRERDWEFVRDALEEKLVRAEELLRRIDDLPEPLADRSRVRAMIEGIIARLERS